MWKVKPTISSTRNKNLRNEKGRQPLTLRQESGCRLEQSHALVLLAHSLVLSLVRPYLREWKKVEPLVSQ